MCLNRVTDCINNGPVVHVLGCLGVCSLRKVKNYKALSVQRTTLSVKERGFHPRRFGFKSNFDLLATQLTPTSKEQMIINLLRTFSREQILFLFMTLFQLVASSLGEKVADFFEQ